MVEYGVCPSCGAEMDRDVYKDIMHFHGWYFSVEIIACPDCGYIDDEQSSIYK